MDGGRRALRFRFVLHQSGCGERNPLLAKARRDHAANGQNPPLSIFGHADPVGQDDYNKPLSGRRADAIYALLTRDAAIWEDLFSHPFGGDIWRPDVLHTMLDVVEPPQPRRSFFEATKKFQGDRGLVADGIIGPKTREQLFLAYMDKICVDEQGQPFRLQKADTLGSVDGDFLTGGADLGRKGDVQGCSEFNPSLLVSTQQLQQMTKAQRDDENSPNRRVLAYLFEPGTRIDPGLWPCPRVSEGPAACRRRFFSDGEERRKPGPQRREYKVTRDTFACRFYDRFSFRSPCEGLKDETLVRIAFDDPFLGPAVGVDVDVTFADGGSERLPTDKDGTIVVLASRGPFLDYRYEREGIIQRRRCFITPADVSTDDGSWQCLVNMGYVLDPQPPHHRQPRMTWRTLSSSSNRITRCR